MHYFSTPASHLDDEREVKNEPEQLALNFKEVVSQLMHSLQTYIVEDSPVIRESLIATLEELLPVEVVGTAEDEHTAVQWLSQPSAQDLPSTNRKGI